MTFDEAFEQLIGHEGGYTAGVGDPGGETKFGISKKSYPSVDIKNLTLGSAKAIYKKDFWDASGCDRLPPSIVFDVFDMCVNSGVGRAVLTLQKATGSNADGRLGPQTIAAAQATPDLRAKFNAYRLQFMTDQPVWDRFGKGWARRIAANLLRA